MNIEIKPRSAIADEYKWDLSSLYESDAAWENELEKFGAETEKIQSFKGTLGSGAKRLREWFDYSTALSRKIDDLFCYANLRKSEDGRASDAQIMFSKAYGRIVRAIAETSFAEPEILSLSEERLAEYAASEEIAPYRVIFDRIMKRKPHTLSEKEEKILAGASEIFSAPGETADMLQDADMVFDDAVDSDGNAVPVSNASYIPLQESDDRVLRESAFRSFYKSYKAHINTFTATYSANVKGDAFQAAARGFSGAREMAVFGEEVPENVYDGLIEAVRRHMPAMHRYAALRKEVMELDELHYYDLYTPLVPDLKLEYSYEEACEEVLDTVKILGGDYAGTVKKAFDDGWIDVYPNEGKAGGAFSSGTYDSKPYILMNFTGTFNCVSTLAHEMGHSMHSYLSKNNQPPQYADYTIFVAEVASTVNEILFTERLLRSDISDEMRIYLLNHYLESFKGTVYRQTMFAEFEKKAHDAVESGGALSADGLCDIYEELVKDYFGDALTFDEEVRYEWARIPHFYRSFYVYKYATSFSAACSIAEGIVNGEPGARERYLRFLSLGCSKDPIESLKIAGVDVSTPEPVERALERFERLLDETEDCLGLA